MPVNSKIHKQERKSYVFERRQTKMFVNAYM